MAYNTKKGSQHTGDIQFEGDPDETQIDFENDSITLKTGGEARLVTNNSHISAYVNIYGSNFYGTSGEFVTLKASSIIGGSPLDISASSVTITGSITLSGSSTMSASAGHFTSVSASSATISTLTASAISGGSPITISGDTITLIGPVTAGTTVISTVHVSSSLNISGAAFYGDGSNLSGIATPAITSYLNPAHQRVILGGTATNAVSGAVGLDYTGAILAITGAVSASLGITGSSAEFATGDFGTLTVSTLVGGSPISISASSITFTGSVGFSGGGTISASAGILSELTASAISGGSPLTLYGDDVTVVAGGVAGTQFTNVHISSSLNISGAAFNAIGQISGATFSGDNITIGGSNLANSALYVTSPTDNSVVAIFKSPSNDTILAMSGSGAVVIGGAGAPYVDGKFNITGSDNEKLVTLKTNSKNPVFYISGSGELYNSGSIILNTTDPSIIFTSSLNSSANATIRLNSADNVLIQNDTLNKYIVLKANDGGTIKEGLRIGGANPEVAVNQGADAYINFRVESENNDHMLFVTGSDQVGVGVSDPAIGVTLDISGSAMRLRNSSTVTGSGAPGVAGEIRWDANYIYICIATDTWKRAEIQGGW